MFSIIFTSVPIYYRLHRLVLGLFFFLSFFIEFIDYIMDSWKWKWLVKEERRRYDLLPLKSFIENNKLSVRTCLYLALSLASRISTLHEHHMEQNNLSIGDVLFRPGSVCFRVLLINRGHGDNYGITIHISS